MHSRYYGYWFGSGTQSWVTPTIVIGALLIVTAAVVWWILRRRRARARATGLLDTQQDGLEDFENQVTALITQRAGEVDQTMIVAALGLPAQLVAERLLKLERAGVIERRWSVDRLTYSVKRLGM